ncbi:ParB/RepB/Spo0J family partition protein [Lactobacillaceae bacterium L1_55_11]|nr:ParB/RepB/Spo0J family partition protein [Lactobacillaceae bacterium L1_55_11]
MVNKKGGLGKGMDSLFGSNKISPEALAHSKAAAQQPQAGEQVQKIDLKKVRANPFQPRKQFDKESLQELADSIRENGLLTPIIVRQVGSDYEIIAGERRFRALKLLKEPKIEAIVRDTNDDTMATLALIENLQRDNLNPIEEAQAYKNLGEQLGLSQTQLAEKLGKERATVANALRLLKLPEQVQELVVNKALSMGQARALLGLKQAQQITAAVQEILEKQLSVRQVEALVKRLNEGPKQDQPQKPVSPFVTEVAEQLEERFGTKVRLKNQRNGRGRIEIDYLSNEDLDRILTILDIEVD